ncbi:MAG: site-specific DNA-methyltransferase [Bacteroidota bacterium]|nr:site-specific DNA-methyltransferase [Bacteroidota bacterium]
MSETISDEATEGTEIKVEVGEFWTAKQRQASSLHEISYRACFKPQLPKFFIERYTAEGDIVYDPFMGRGTTIIEAALLNRNVVGNDVNPLSIILTQPRLNIPHVEELKQRMKSIPFSHSLRADIELSMFYHPKTESEIVSLQNYLLERKHARTEDKLDAWIRMVATNRLTGHSSGFFSVYTLPPNQAASQESQKKINRKLKQKPEYRDVKKIILKKTKSLLRNLTQQQYQRLSLVGSNAKFFSTDASNTSKIPDASVQLTVASPPFLDIVQYSSDNWLRCWFNGIDDKSISEKISVVRSLEEWCGVMRKVFVELYRITKSGGYVAFEVGEVRKGTVRLDDHVVPLGFNAGFMCEGVFINQQKFTKTANIWGIKNNSHGTNTNRIVLFRK